ncbi:hypothetical protein ACVXG8_01085 [Escherichia coli]
MPDGSARAMSSRATSMYSTTCPRCFSTRLNLPLVLVQQRDRMDQRQVFHVVAPGAGFVAHERELWRTGSPR